MTHPDRSLPLNRWRRSAVLAAVLLLLVACTPPPAAQRPREGARPQVQVDGTPLRLEAIPPPTLSIAGGLIPTATPTPTPDIPPPPPSPSPGRGGAIAAASPGASPGVAPIISGLQPAPNTTLPAGDVVISARVSATSDLVDISAFVDGEEIPLDLGNGTARIKSVSFVRTFISGSHEVRVQARDDRGQLGGYRWRFNVGAPRQTAPAPPRPATATPAVPSFTPPPIPTRRPTSASAPPPAYGGLASPTVPRGPR